MNKQLKSFVVFVFAVLFLSYIWRTIAGFSFSSHENAFNQDEISIIFRNSHIYLVLGEKVQITDNISITSQDNNIVAVEDSTLVAKKVGRTNLAVLQNDEVVLHEVIVTDLVTLPKIDNNKPYLPCNRYTEAEADLLDDILSYRINIAGEKTRAGAVAAARFLALEFPYRIAYFYENGRLLTNGTRTLADGEGRYYHIGLYLHEKKMQDINPKDQGPAIWGCPLYSGVVNRTSSNGLDCSGFISWLMLNAGFDVGDGGAGISESIDNDLDDLGPKLSITSENLRAQKYRVGDLLSRYGHIGIIIGIDENNIYVAEALDYDLHVKTYTLDSLLTSDWQYIILLDDLYQKDGNLQNMW